jgi:hypothetical protein
LHAEEVLVFKDVEHCPCYSHEDCSGDEGKALELALFYGRFGGLGHSLLFFFILLKAIKNY